jgi:RNA recognition motif-containing protein
MVRNSVNRKFKGFAYIDFKENSSLKKAIKKYHNKDFRGRKLVCDASVTSMKKGYKKRNPNAEYTEEN